MKKKLNSILLIDDDVDCNFFHQRLINKMGYAENIYIARNGKEAIDLLQKEQDGKYLNPDIIFLDINMPVMNGWEFIEEYQKLKEYQKAKIVLMMLTTSLNESDIEKAKKYKDIKGYKNKYLDSAAMDAIFKDYFTDGSNTK